MATVEEGLQAQIRNIEATYGKPMSEWLAIIAASGLTKHTDIVNMLKNDRHDPRRRPPGIDTRPAECRPANRHRRGQRSRQRPVHRQEGQPSPHP